MTQEANQFVAEAVKRVTLSGSFSPGDIGARIGLNKAQSEAVARSLSNAGVLVLGFDCAAHFSPAYRKAHGPVVHKGKAGRAKKPRRHTPAAGTRPAKMDVAETAVSSFVGVN